MSDNIKLREKERRIVIEQGKPPVPAKEAYEKANEINEDPDKEARIIEDTLVVKDVLKG